MLKWVPTEFHTHTVHSDGDFTLTMLCEKAKEMGLEAIVLTDHNTISAHNEILSTKEKTGINIIPGMELTTFYGHITAVGVKKYIEWRDCGIDDINIQLERIHKAGGIAGIAHPFVFGSPICTGCHFEYDIKNCSCADFIEVWRREYPSLSYYNKAAFSLWMEKLNEGYKIYAVSALDWHSEIENKNAVAATYVGIEEASSKPDFFESFMDAVKKGRICSAIGPLLTFEIEDKSLTFKIGDIINRRTASNNVKVIIKIDFEKRKNICLIDNKPLKIILNSSSGILYEHFLDKFNIKDSIEIIANIGTNNLKWVICEIFGSIDGIYQEIAFTNPVFFAE